MDNESTNSNIILFLIFTFGLPLICVLLIQNFVIFQVGIMNFIINGLEAMTPTLAALITVAITSGRIELRAFVKRCYISNLNIWCIVLSVMLPAIVLTIARLTSFIFLEDIPFSMGITEKKLILIMWALVAEEFGWRGFLQEKLDRYFASQPYAYRLL